MTKLYNVALAVACLFKNKWVSVHEVTIREGVDPYLMLVVPDYVSVLPWRRTTDGIEVLMLRVFRQAAGTVWEPCEGVVPDGETDYAAIRRELDEEAGIDPQDSSWQQPLFVGAGLKATDRAIRHEPVVGGQLCPTMLRMYLLELPQSSELGEQSLDPEEEITPYWLPLDEAIGSVMHEASVNGANLALMYLLKCLEEYPRTIPGG